MTRLYLLIQNFAAAKMLCEAAAFAFIVFDCILYISVKNHSKLLSTTRYVSQRQWLVARHEAATKVQAFFRGSRVRRWYLRLRDSVVGFQAASRGYLLRKTLPALRRRLPSPRNRSEVCESKNNNVSLIGMQRKLAVLKCLSD